MKSCQLSQPLLGGSDSSGSANNSPLPPSASRSGLAASSGSDESASRRSPLWPAASPASSAAAAANVSAKVAVDPWPLAVYNALPITLMNIVQALSQAQLVCMGTPLDAAFVAAMHILGLIVMQAALLGGSRVSRYAIATSDVTVAMLCAGAVSSVYELSDAGPAISADAQEQTALAALGVCTLLQACCYLALGRLRASELVQYLPYPVVCGLLGVTGLGLCRSALGVAGLNVPSVGAFWESATSERPAQAFAALAFAACSLSISSLSNSGTAFLLCVPASLLLFYGGATFNGASTDELVTTGWLFERSSFDSAGLTELWTSRRFGEVLWRKSLPDTVPTFCRCLVSLTAIVLKVLAIEASAGAPVDIDHELRVCGYANVVCGACGGLLANHSAQYVGPLRRAGVASRRVALAVLLSTVLVLASGAPLMDSVPRFIPGGMLLAIGAQMCLDWAWASRTRMDTVGYSVLCAMMGAWVVVGPMHAIFFGVVFAVFSSHLRAARLNALKYHLTADLIHSAVSRPNTAQLFLEKHGRAIHLLGLEGFLFEGSTARLLRYVLAKIRASPGSMRFLILDMAVSQGVDPSACALLGRAARLLSDCSVQLVLAAPQPSLLPTLVAHSVLDPEVLAGEGAPGGRNTALAAASAATSSSVATYAGGGAAAAAAAAAAGGGGGGGGGGGAGRAVYFATLDLALEWCEDRLILYSLSSSPQVGSHPPPPTATATATATAATTYLRPARGGARPPHAPSSLPAGLSTETLLAYGTQQPAKPGERLTISGVANRDLIVVPSQGVSVEVSIDVGDAGGPISVATLRHGGIFGAQATLLGVSALFSAQVTSCERGATLLVVGGIGVSKLRASQPLLLQKLLAAATSQQQDLAAILARRTLLWRGGGWRGPSTGSEAAAARTRRSSSGFPLVEEELVAPNQREQGFS